ncbi:MAG: peptidoglycan-binding domain-containing protein [bacterium]|nr:peptidoglycan-binding domain-containing protein [bacterium]
MQKGNHGLDVVNLQKVLNKEGVYPGAIFNGNYGSLTELAVKKFQAKYNIVSEGSPSTTGYGRAGWATIAKLNALYASNE